MTKSQCDIILDHLKSGRTLTKAQCWEKYKIMNCGARINELRNRGHNINTTMATNDQGSEYAIYSIPAPRPAVKVGSHNQMMMSL